MKNYVISFLLIVLAVSSIASQSKMTHCTLETAAGEKMEGFIKHYTPKNPGFSTKNLKLYTGKKFKKIFTNHIQLIVITSDSTVYKPRIDAKNNRRMMKVMQENDEFSVYLDFAGRTSGGMAGGFNTWVDFHYYFRKDDKTYQLPYNQLKIPPSTYFESVDELVLEMQKQARVKNVVLPDYLASYKK